MSAAVMEQTLEHLKSLKLYRMAERLEGVLEEASKGEWPYADVISRLVEEQALAKRDHGITMRTTMARFPYVKTLESFDFKFQPSVDQKRIKELALCHFAEHGENVIFLGPPGEIGRAHV